MTTASLEVFHATLKDIGSLDPLLPRSSLLALRSTDFQEYRV